MPCQGGYRGGIEEGKRWAREEREHRRTDQFRRLWVSLVERVHGSPNGFDTLSEPEKLYFAVGLLELDVYNGGFHQYFFNNAGSKYVYAEKGLVALGATGTLGLLQKAKEALFPGGAIPVETDARRRALPRVEADSDGRTPKWSEELDDLDNRYWADSETLTRRLQRFARDHGLVS